MTGLKIRTIRFTPTFDKRRGESCGGVTLHITEPRAVRSVTATLALLAAVHKLRPSEFEWLPPPYEYEHHKMPIDILFGSARLRERLASGSSLSPADVSELTKLDDSAWRSRSAPFRLYD